MKQQGYDGHSGLGLNKQGMLEPLQTPKLLNNQGLGFVPIKVIIQGIGSPSSEVVDASNETETSKES